MDTQLLKKVLTFLCSVPPETNLRLALQLALAADIPDSKRQELFAKLKSDIPLEDLLKDKLLAQILEADGELGEAESNMLLEAMESIGLVVPSDLAGAELILDDLSSNLTNEIAEIRSNGTLQDSPLVW